MGESGKLRIKRLSKYFIIFAFALVLTLQNPQVLASTKPKPTWTFIVYLDCDNSLDMFGPINLQQMSDGLAAGANVNVIVLMDRLNEPAFTYEVTSGTANIVQWPGEVDMGNPDTLTAFVVFTIENYPADHYVLDLWDHGGGYRGVCWDESSGNHLSPHDVETALASAEAETGSKIDVVGFDACLMGMVEICYELKDVTNIVIGSEMLIPGYGWPYTQLMAYISNNPTVDMYTLSEELVKEYVAYYPKYTVQLSAIDEAEMPAFALNLDSLAAALKANVADYYKVISGARGSSQQNHILGTGSTYYYIDLYDFASSINVHLHDTSIQTRCTNLISEFNLAVFAEGHTAKLANLDKKEFGLTINFPPNSKQYSISYEAYVPSFVQETAWLSFLKAYYDTA
jgi:hypothetical protein